MDFQKYLFCLFLKCGSNLLQGRSLAGRRQWLDRAAHRVDRFALKVLPGSEDHLTFGGSKDPEINWQG